MSSKIFSSALSKKENWREAVKEISSKIRHGLAGKSCDLLIFFVSEFFEGFDTEGFVKFLSDRLPCRVLIGCNACGVIGTSREIEMEAAVSALAMHLPKAKLYPFYVSASDLASFKEGADLINFFDIYPTDKPHFISVGDPASFDIERFLHLFNEAYKGLPMVGGLASGGVMNVPNWLVLNGNLYSEGLAGLALVGEIEFEIIVSQGCRPIGKPFIITRAEDNILYELAGRPALTVVRELLSGLAPKDKKLAEQSLFVGLVMNEQQSSFKRGDFLIRNLVGFDPDAESLMIGSGLKVGQTLQFQVRDADTSEEDLKILLGKLHQIPPQDSAAAMLVSCCGRGKGLYGRPDHDVLAIEVAKGPLPLAGFFANGEIGPVSGKNFVHGYTSSLVIFR